MGEPTDRDVLERYAGAQAEQDPTVFALREFRKRFDQYQRAKTGRQARRVSVCRPYIEVFRQPRKGAITDGD